MLSQQGLMNLQPVIGCVYECGGGGERGGRGGGESF